MQIDVNSAADRAHLMRAQLTSVRSGQLNSKAPVLTDGRALSDLVSVPGKLTDLAWAPAKKISDVRTNPSISPKAPTVVPQTRTVQLDGTGTTSSTPRRIAEPTVDLKSSAQTLAKNPVVSDPGPAEPTNRLDALLADWGKKDSPYDLDGNGIVGVNDLLLLLGSLTGGPQKPEPPHGDVADLARPRAKVLTDPQLSDPSSPDPPPTSKLDALLADWGKKDSPFDLDGNGIVGVNDLLLLLGSLTGGPQKPEPPHGDVADPARPRAKALTDPQLSDPSSPNPPPTSKLDGLLADWGKKDSPFDLDGNGIVGVNDLLLLLAQLSGGGSQQPQEPHGDVASPRRPSARVSTELPAQPNALVDHDPAITSGDPIAISVNATTIAPRVIDDLDQNNSGTIAPPEVVGSTPTFDRVDRNHNGALSRSKLAAQIRDMLLDHIAMSPNAKLDQFVREAMKRMSDHDNRNGAPGKRNAAVQRSSRVYQQANLEATARQLAQRLTDQGATELRKLVQEGELSANEKRAVLDQISILRPGAHSVNLVG